MATACQGVTVLWGGSALGEVTEINVVRGGELPQGRGGTHATSRPWSLDLGTIDIKCLSTANLSMDQYGLRKVLSLTGGGLTFSTKAVCQTLRMSGKVNDATRYEASFKIQSD